jgi:limonene-1,2-epoxide hydrolase
MQRRTFVSGLAAGTVSVIALENRVFTAELAAAERANVKLIDDMYAAWTSLELPGKMSALFTEDCLFRASVNAPVTKGFGGILDDFKRVTTGGQRIEFKVIETFAKGSVVVHHRTTRFVSSERSRENRVVASFFIKAGRIAEWTDYPVRP